MNNDTRIHRHRRRRAITVIGTGAATVLALATPALAHPSFPAAGPVFANPSGGTGAGTQTPPYVPGSTNTLNLRVPFERDGVIVNGALDTTVDIKTTIPDGWTNPVCGAAETSVGNSQVGTAVPGWSCAVETTADGHKTLHWSGPQVSPAQSAADSAQFFTFEVTVPSPASQTSYGAFGGPEGFFVIQQYADPSDTAIWKCPNDPRPATDVATGLVRTVAGTTPPPPAPSPLPPPVVHASDGKIVFQSDRDGNNEIYVMNADGTGVTRLTNNSAADTQPALSPDGTRITFTSNRDGNNEIYVMNADGTGLTRLTNDPASDSQPVFSPDGTLIAFTKMAGSGETANNEIFVMNAFTGASQVNLTNNPAGDDQPAFSPDGRIAFVRFQNATRNIYIMNADGTAQKNLTKNTASNGGPVFGPHGRIAFHSNKDSNNNEIYLMKADGTGLARLTNNPANDQRPAFSPDGTKVIFTTDRSGNQEINVTSANGTSGALDLTSKPATDDWARWAPIPGRPTTTTLNLIQVPLRFGLGGRVLPIAHVAPVNATGTVQFKDGNINIGTPVPVIFGLAIGRLKSLPPGPHALTATFIPAKLSAFQLSTSNSVTLTF
ncbi:MAG TPA: Ig-like domain repeat protein [Pseudonocardiaceae bacterium]|nr:Ig-like domain repeat protein [Pseudonocardiaceae bacterium]